MSSWDQANRGENLVWFGEIERKLAKLANDYLLLTVLPLNYSMGKVLYIMMFPLRSHNTRLIKKYQSLFSSATRISSVFQG